MRENEGYDPEDDFAGTGTQLPDGFVDKEAISRALSMERQMHPEEQHEDLTHRLLRENAPRVAMQLVQIALTGSSERMRLDAGKYVIDRVMGPVGKETHRADSPLDKMVREMQADVEAAANAAFDAKQGDEE